jgi:rhamnosyltransferase
MNARNYHDMFKVELELPNIDTSQGLGLIIPTMDAGDRWSLCLDAILEQSVTPKRLMIIDSASTDCTVSLAKSAGFEITRIEKAQFNHGGTRQWAAEALDDCSLLVYLTQDAVLANSSALCAMRQAFSDPNVAVVYGRQLPHKGATSIESHARIFNYGPDTLIKNAETSKELGTKVFFCSNSFAAYRRSLLLSLGGFRRDLILGEDMEFAARAIKAGYSNVYCAAAAVYHSHDYTIRQTLSRYFDIGVFDETNPWMRKEFGSHTGEGFRFAISELQYLQKHDPAKIPKALSQMIAKFSGYRLGRWHRLLPRTLKKGVSLFPSYWA